MDKNNTVKNNEKYNTPEKNKNENDIEIKYQKIKNFTNKKNKNFKIDLDNNIFKDQIKRLDFDNF